MIRQIPESAFPEFVAALWQKQGWQTTVTEKSGKSFVALQREGAEGLIWARPGAGDGVSGQELQRFAMVCKQYGVGEGAVVTPGTFTEDAETIGSQAGVQLVDGEKLKTIVEARELHDLVESFADGNGIDGQDEGDERDGEGVSLPISLPDGIPRTAVAAVFVAILAIVAATVVAPMILGTSGGVEQSGGGWTVTANSTAPHNATGTLDVRWNAKRVSKLNPESGDDGVYKPREGEQFLLASMNVTNSGNDSVGLRPQEFVLRSNGTVWGYQPLTNTTGFQPSVLEAGQSVTVWIVFSIETDVTNVTIVPAGRLRRDRVRTRFTRDGTMAVET